MASIFINRETRQIREKFLSSVFANFVNFAVVPLALVLALPGSDFCLRILAGGWHIPQLLANQWGIGSESLILSQNDKRVRLVSIPARTGITKHRAIYSSAPLSGRWGKR
jgi:hypothetical protein